MFVLAAFILAVLPIITSLLGENIAYLLDKKDAYTDVYAPSITSGLFPILIFLLLFYLFKKNMYALKVPRILYLILILEIISFIIAKFTYAGLRFQNLFLFVLLVFVVQNLNLLNFKTFSKKLIFISCLSLSLFVKNISTIAPDGISAFVPYNFYWEERNIK